MNQFKVVQEFGHYIPMVKRAKSWNYLVMVDQTVEATRHKNCMMLFPESLDAHALIAMYKLQKGI